MSGGKKKENEQEIPSERFSVVWLYESWSLETQEKIAGILAS